MPRGASCPREANADAARTFTFSNVRSPRTGAAEALKYPAGHKPLFSSSPPDVAKKGRGTTAVSTVFGSNIFDILIALALPWAIYSSIFGPITVFESLGFGTAYALTTIMIATFALFVILSATNGWVVTHPHAWIYLAIYAAFVVYVILDAIPGIVPGPASR